MYKSGTLACILIMMLVCTSGCSLSSGDQKNSSKPGISSESVAKIPELPDEYSAPPQARPKTGPASPVTPTLTEKIPDLVPAQRTTINGTDSSGNSTDSNTTTPITDASVPVAQFISDVTAGYAPLAVRFTDASQNIPTAWSWDFGDRRTSFLQNPMHTYSTGGFYTVRLIAANKAGSSGYSGNISVYAPGFSAAPVNGKAPLTVTFTETGTGYPEPTEWNWDFGDGSACSSREKIHVYTSPGTYEVKLRISGTAGTTWVNRSAAVTVT
jgi:PKD repeat protein